MLGLIVTETHILFGDWTTQKDNHVLNDIRYIELSKSVKETLKSKDTIHKVLESALNGLPLKDSQVILAIDDELLYHDIFSSDKTLSNDEIWDYIQWESVQRWGDLNDYYTTFAEIEMPTSINVHSITCPTLLISELKRVIAKYGGNPIWLGPVSSIYLDNNEYKDAVYLSNSDSLLKYYFRGNNGYSEGKLQFLSGHPRTTIKLGDKEEQAELFSEKGKREFLIIDLVSEENNRYLRQLNPKHLIPFEGIDVKVEDIDENIAFNLLNALSIMIKFSNIENLLNFFRPAKIHQRKSSEKEVPNSQKISTDEVISNKVPHSRIRRNRQRGKLKSGIISFCLIVLLGLIGYYLFFNSNGKEFITDLKDKTGLGKNVGDNSAIISYFNQHYNQSAALIKAYSSITSVVSPDSIISLVISDTSGKLEFIGTDSLSVPDFKVNNYTMEAVECCGGIKQKIEFNIFGLPDIQSNIWLDLADVVNHLQSNLGEENIRQLSTVEENGATYIPIILKISTLEMMDNIIQYLRFAGDNIVLRKINITNTPPLDGISGTFYIAIFEPI